MTCRASSVKVQPPRRSWVRLCFIVGSYCNFWRLYPVAVGAMCRCSTPCPIVRPYTSLLPVGPYISSMGRARHRWAGHPVVVWPSSCPCTSIGTAEVLVPVGKLSSRRPRPNEKDREHSFRFTQPASASVHSDLLENPKC